ncbi:MAG: hypothetical protein ACLTS6_22105 [Anaerobutyricum sp.]
MQTKLLLKGNPAYLKIFTERQCSDDAFLLYNNHCHDYEAKCSCNDIYCCFKKNKMPYASYGKVSVYKTNGKKIGMIAVNGLDGVSSSERL